MVVGPVTGPKAEKIHKCDWTEADFATLKELIAKEVPKGDNKRAAMARIEQRLDPMKALEGEDEMAKFRATRERESPAPEAYANSLARQWCETGCAADGAPYVLRGLLRRLDDPRSSPFAWDSPEKSKLAAAFLDEAHCPGAQGLSEADKARLKEIAAPAAPQAPKP